jgi:hypothetical protein
LDYCPVVLPVYNEKEYRAASILKYDGSLNKTQYQEYGKLVEMAHSEMPWKETPKNEVITPEKLKRFFREELTLNAVKSKI